MNLSLIQIEYNKPKKLKLRVIHIIILIFALCIVSVIVLSVIVLGRLIRLKRNTLETAVLSATDEQLEDEVKQEGELEEGISQEEITQEPEKANLPQLTEEAKQKLNNIYHSDEKVAYLTFDDGPSSTVTPIILDILKANDIKATFFTLGSCVKAYPDIVKKEYEEGHYIANHGYSHVYKQIYANPQKVLEEYQETEALIQNAIGESEFHSHLIRFPGGSRGSKYEGIIKEAIQILEQNEIAYVDWNCLTGDSAGNNDKEALMQELINTSEGKNSLVILMHDAANKVLTSEILQDAINYLREQGYAFKSFYDIME